MFKKVINHWVCFLKDENGLHTVHEVYYLDDKTIKFRSIDIDGGTRYYGSTVAEFEFEFKINFADVLLSNAIHTL